MNFRTYSVENKLSSFIFLLLFLEIPLEAYAEGVPRKLAIDDEKNIVFTHVNQTLELKCPIDTSSTKTFVEWSRGNQSLYMEPGYDIKKKGVLKIKSVAMNHAGTYTCEGVNGYGFVKIKITVIVDKPEVENVEDTSINSNSVNPVHFQTPSIKRRTPTNFIQDVGGQATLHCVATGKPTPHIFWIKNGVQIKNAEIENSKGKVHSTLKLRGLQTTDAGIYKCIATNKAGEDHLDFYLQVPEIPKPRIISLKPPTATIKEGEAAVFWCEVSSKAGLKLHIKWFKQLNKEEITDSHILDDKTLFPFEAKIFRPVSLPNGTSTNSELDGLYKSKLVIQNSCKEDSGTYVCFALNDKGFNLQNVTLTVIRTAAKSFPTHSHHFAASDTSFIAIVIIALVIILGAILLVSQLYCRGMSQKSVSRKKAIFDPECGNSPQGLAYLKKHGKKDSISYPELNDPLSKSKLLCTNSVCSYETENQISKPTHVKTYIH